MSKLDLETFVPYRLMRAAARISQEFREIYDQEHDLTVAEWRVLATLGQFEEMTATAIGEHSALHKTKVSRAVRALELRHWIARRDLQDRRNQGLTLTKSGRVAYARIVPRAIAFEAKLLKRIGVKKSAILAELSDLEAGDSEPQRRHRKPITA